MRIALEAWRGITLRKWAWTTAIALLFLLSNVVALLPALLNAVPNRVGLPLRDWDAARSVAVTLVTLVVAYCILLGISIAEHGARDRVPPLRRYVVAVTAACGAAILLEISLYTLVPGFAPFTGGVALLLSVQELSGRIVLSVANLGLAGGLVLAVYVRFRSARLARDAFNAAALERVDAGRQVLASRLAAMQAQIEPRFLLSTLAQVEALYDREPEAGDRMLDGLIAYLHAALPQLRGLRSTLGQEAALVESYLRVIQIRMGSRLRYGIDIRPELRDCDFPPMMLLPLIDDALRNGLEPLPHGGALNVAADAQDERLRVRIADDGLPRTPDPDDDFAVATLHERLSGLYGSSASLGLSPNVPRGVVAIIEVPLVDARNHC